MADGAWVKVGDSEAFGIGFHRVDAAGQPVVLALLEGEFFAFEPTCPHARGPLHLAEVDGTVISCPLHAWRFDLADGGRETHGYRGIRMYDVRLEDGELFLAV